MTHRMSSREDEQPQDVLSNKLPRVSKRSSSEYYSDEHPEIPKVRRASLYLDEKNIPFKDTDKSIMRARSHRSRVYEPPTLARRPLREQNRQAHTMLLYLQDLSHNQKVIQIGTMTLVGLILLPIIVSVLINSFHPVMGRFSLAGAGSLYPPSTSARSTDPHQLVITPTDTDHPAPPVFATAAYLLDADTGATLYAKNPFMHLPVMSTTKLMTAILAIEQGNPDQNITINDTMQNDINQLPSDSTLFGFKKGETYSLRDVLYGMLLVSGNDAAVVVADALGGNLQHFVNEMNERASQLGLLDTHFMNPHGLLMDGHYSSAHDLAVLGRYAMTLPLFHQISGAQQYHITNNGKHQEHYAINGNQFLWWYPGVDGGKPGWDAAKNFVQVISCTRNHHHLIGVVIQTINWWTDMRDLMNWGFDSFKWISPHDVDLHHPIVFDSDANYFSSDTKNFTIPTTDGERYYIYTGYSISGPIMDYFDKGGGLKTFGYPNAMPITSNNTVISQHFELATIQCDSQTKQCKKV
ncbi:MAG: D-alanyl-D-alanine carboxypeptidase [Ktedonobacteraceae bacterium]|nr:D-alanyl-D-alanine carboxypeptidase [Ktedonobacteraceae bacterium]